MSAALSTPSPAGDHDLGCGLSAHRIEALTDGIYAAAMTLLVIGLCIGQLGFVSLLPFSCSLIGEHGREMASQVIYSINMAALAVLALLTSRYIRRHSDGVLMGMPQSTCRAAQVRLFGLMLISALAVLIQAGLPMAGNVAFSLMAFMMPISRAVERRSQAGRARPARG